MTRDVKDDIDDQQGFFRDGEEIIGVDLPSAIPTSTITPDTVTTPGSIRFDLTAHVPATSLRLASGSLLTSADLATIAALPACTYANGSSGLGATLTGNSNGALAAVDFVTPVAGDRIVVRTQAAPLQNGLYEVTTLGTGSVPFVLTRCVEADLAADLVSGVIVFITGGTTYAGSAVSLASGTYTVGTTDQFWRAPSRPDATPTDVYLGPARNIRHTESDFDEFATTITTTAPIPGTRIGVVLNGTVAQASQIGATDTVNGAIALSTGTDTTGSAAVQGGQFGAAFNLDLPAHHFAKIKIPTLTTVGQTFVVRSGFVNNMLAAPTSGVFFEAAADGGNWDAVTVHSSTETRTDVGVAPVGAAYRQFTIDYDPVTAAVRFYIGSTLVATHTTNITTATVSGAVTIVKATGTTARTANIDYITFSMYDDRGFPVFIR